MPVPDNLVPLDPFTQTYRAIRKAILDYPHLQPIIKDGNFADASVPTFENFVSGLNPEDTPDMVFLQGAKRLQPYGRNSLVSSFKQRYMLIATYEKLCVLDVNKVAWMTSIALMVAGENLGLSHVREWEINDTMDDAFGQREWKRDQMRYLTAFNIDVEMFQDRRYLLSL